VEKWEGAPPGPALGASAPAGSRGFESGTPATLVGVAAVSVPQLLRGELGEAEDVAQETFLGLPRIDPVFCDDAALVNRGWPRHAEPVALPGPADRFALDGQSRGHEKAARPAFGSDGSAFCHHP
jgi:hypothetical protein